MPNNVPQDTFDFEEAQDRPPDNFDWEEASAPQQAGTGGSPGVSPLPTGFKLPVPPEYDPVTFQKRYGGQWSGGIGSPYAPEQMAEAVSTIKAPIGLAGKILEGGFDTASELASDFLRRSGIDPAANPGKPLMEPLRPGEGEMLAQSVLAPFTRAGAPEWATGALKEGGELLRSFTEPGQLATLPAAAVFKPVQGAFLTQAALGIPTSLQDIMQARGPEETSRAITRAAANIGMAELMRRGMVKPSTGEPAYAEAVRRDQEKVPSSGQIPQEGQGVGGPDVYQGGGQPQGVTPQEAQVAPEGVEAQKVEEAPKLSPGDLEPALLVNDKPVTGGEGHKAIFENAQKRTDLSDEEQAGLFEAFADDAKHVFVDKNGKVYTRQEAATALGEKDPLQSERLRKLQSEGAKPASKGDAAELNDLRILKAKGERLSPENEARLKDLEAKDKANKNQAAWQAQFKAELERRQAAQGPPPINVEANEAEIGKGGETGIEMASTGAGKSGLPPSINWRGPGFIAEMMEAARQLGTAIRSRVTLKPGVLGQYTRKRSSIGQDDKIEVGDIRNQGTVAHEMGHDVDALIWPDVNLAYSQQSLGQRVPGANPKELHNELLSVSELMRGPITGSKGHQAYRRRAAELIADFFSMYVHEPEKARKMAPKFSKGFEAALANKPEAAGVINQLLEGNVAATPGEIGGTGPTARPGETPGAVPARPEQVLPGRDLQAAVAGENLVKGLVRLYEASKQKARIIAEQWRKLVPDRAQRGDVGAFIEGVGNVEIPGDTIADVKSRMTPKMERLAKDYRLAQEEQRNKINEYLKDSEETEYIAYLEDYLPHFYADAGTRKGRSAISRFAKDSPNGKERKLPTLQEARDIGLTPISQDPTVLYEHWANINWRIATNRQLMHALKNMKDSSGEPVVVPAKDAPDGWHVTNNPLVQKVYARPLGDKGIILWKGGAAIHPDVWRSVRQMLYEPVSGDFSKAFDMLNSVTRANAFAFSLFHDLTLRSAALGAMMGKNPLRGLYRLMERNPKTGELELFRSTRGLGKELLQDEEAVSDAALHGLKFSWTESESYQHAAREGLEKLAARWREVPVLGKTAGLARDIQRLRQEGLWKNTHDAFKIIAYHDAVNWAGSIVPRGTDMSHIKQQIASALNDAFGGQEWQTKFWLSPQWRQRMSRFFLAPDWTLSTFRSVPGLSDVASQVARQSSRLSGRGPGPAQFEGPSGNLRRARFWGAELAALAGATVAAQYAIYHAFGDPNKGDKEWVWDNEMGQNRRIDVTPMMRKFPWHDPKDNTRYYVNLGKRPEEVLGWITHPEANIRSKMSRPVAEIFNQITGTEGDMKEPWKQDHETFLESLSERGKSLGSQFIPFTFAGNQFALSLPYRKGMTKFKAEQAYESVYEIQADTGNIPASVRAFLRGVPNPQGTLREMVGDISDAAARNGVNAEATRKRSLSAVRGHHYDLFFKALQKGDQSEMQKEAQALINLGATAEQRRQSVERKRQMLEAPVE